MGSGAFLSRKQTAKPDVTREVLSYFLRNPRAADSLEGVAGWRLMDEVVRRRVDETRIALDWLVAEGFLQAVSTSSSGPIFSLNEKRRAEAEGFLAAASGPAVAAPGAGG
jgi:hypothetical protein